MTLEEIEKLIWHFIGDTGPLKLKDNEAYAMLMMFVRWLDGKDCKIKKMEEK